MLNYYKKENMKATYVNLGSKYSGVTNVMSLFFDINTFNELLFPNLKGKQPSDNPYI